MSNPALAGPIRYGKYTLQERLGSGGMAEVYLALQEGAGGFAKRVVVKRILSEFANDRVFVDLFLNEAQLAAHLSHPNIVQIFDMGQEGDTYFIAMEYVPGPNLLALLRYASLGNDLRPTAFAKIASGVAEGLHYAHSAIGPDGKPLEIVHRDVNPPNIIVSLDGVPKVCDFGVAKSSARETTTGTHLKGKQTYMAPEQIRGEKLDGRADLFSLGVVLFETTTGKRLFKRDSELAVLNAVLSDPIPRPSTIVPGYPEKLEEIVMWCLERERDRRCPDARTLHDALEEYLRADKSYMSQLALGEWVKQLVPPDVQKSFTSIGSSPSLQRPKTSSRSPRPGPIVSEPNAPTSARVARPNTAPPPPIDDAPSGSFSISVSSPIAEPQTEPFTLPAAPRFPWKWVALGAGILAGAGGIVWFGKSRQVESTTVAAPQPAPAAPKPAAAPAPAPAQPAQNAEADARFYVEEARRLVGEQKFGPAAVLVAKAKALNPSDPRTNVGIAELEEEAEVGARLAGAQQALADGDLQRASSLAKLVLDKEPTQPRALELLKQIHARTEPVRPPTVAGRMREGTVRVEAPAGSRVYIDDVPVGEAPIARYMLSAGKHRVEVRRDGYRPDVRELEVYPRQSYVVSAHVEEKEQVQVALQQAQPAPRPEPRPEPRAEPKPAPVAAEAPKPVAVAPTPTPAPAPPPVHAAPVGLLFTDQMTRPVRVSGPDPQYPDAAREARASGVVLAQCDISESGAVHGCRIIKHVPFMDQPVLEALQSWQMKPATLDGKPVALRSYNFTLKIVAPR